MNERTTIGKAFQFKSGVMLSAQNMKSGNYPVFGGNGVSGYHNEFMFEEPKIVIGRVGAYCGNVHLTKPKSWITDNALFIDKKLESYSDDYLIYLLRNLHLNQYSSQSGQPLISYGRIKDVEIPLPPLATQKRIAAILDAADLYRQKTKALVAKYDQLAQSLFLEMFGDPVRNEKDWKKVEMKKLCSFQKESIIPDRIIADTKYIGLENIEKETGNILEINVVNDGELKSNKFVFDENYILYGKLRPYLNKVALPNFKGICSTDIIPIRPIKDLTNRQFICQIMRSKGFVSFAHEKSSGANLPRISPKEIEKYPIINPPIPLQTQFATRIQLIEAQKQQALSALQKSETLFNSLLQKAFKGELVS